MKKSSILIEKSLCVTVAIESLIIMVSGSQNCPSTFSDYSQLSDFSFPG